MTLTKIAVSYLLPFTIATTTPFFSSNPGGFTSPIYQQQLEPVLTYSYVPSATSTLEEKFGVVFGKDAPVMLKIASCESQMRMYDIDGSVLRGVAVPQDRGLLQINENYWLKKSKELGYNIYDIDGHLDMAKYILDTQGVNAWLPSKSCWSKATL